MTNQGKFLIIFYSSATVCAKLADLKRDCENASTNSLKVLPGFTFTAKYADMKYSPDCPWSWGSVTASVFQNVENLPAEKQLADPYSLFWKFFGGELCGGKKSPPTLKHPGKNKISPFSQRFWRGFDLKTFSENGKTLNDSSELFIDLLASGYGPYPRLSREMNSVDELSPDISRAQCAVLSAVVSEGGSSLFCKPPLYFVAKDTLLLPLCGPQGVAGQRDMVQCARP